MTKRFVKGDPSRIIEDCDYPIDGYNYTVDNEWAYVWKDGIKKYRIKRSYDVDIVLWSITKRNSGEVRSEMVMTYIQEHGEEV